MAVGAREPVPGQAGVAASSRLFAGTQRTLRLEHLSAGTLSLRALQLYCFPGIPGAKVQILTQLKLCVAAT